MWDIDPASVEAYKAEDLRKNDIFIDEEV